MSTSIASIDGSRIVLSGVDWATYEGLRSAPENSQVRMVYDRGVLELMSPSMLHERLAYLIGLLIAEWAVARKIPIHGCRATTFKREDLHQGLEPDNCYYVQNEPRMRGRDEVDLSVDPPPDLAVEVDIMSSSLRRLPVYAALGVLEVWRCDGSTLHIHLLGDAGQYHEAERSVAFPDLPAAEVMRFVDRRAQTDDTTLILEFRDWVKQKFTP